MKRKLLGVLTICIVVAAVAAFALQTTMVSPSQEQASQTVGKSFREKYGPLPARTYVVRGKITEKAIRPIGSASDYERSESADERARQAREMSEDRWLAFFDVDVSKWVDGRGTHGDGPKSIALLHGVLFNASGEPAGTSLSGDWPDRSIYEKLGVGQEFEFHIVTEALYGKYYGLVNAYPVENGKVSEEDLEGNRMRNYRYTPYEGSENDS